MFLYVILFLPKLSTNINSTHSTSHHWCHYSPPHFPCGFPKVALKVSIFKQAFDSWFLQLCFDSITLDNPCCPHLVYLCQCEPVILQDLGCVFSNSGVRGQAGLCRSHRKNRGRPGAFIPAGVRDERGPFLVMRVWAHLVEGQHRCNTGISPVKNHWPVRLSFWCKTLCEGPSQLRPIIQAHLRRQISGL